MKIVNYCMSLFQKKGMVVKFGTARLANTEPTTRRISKGCEGK